MIFRPALFAFLGLSLSFIVACSSSSSPSESGDTDLDADPDLADGDQEREDSGDADETGDGDAEPEGLACDEPWPIPSGAWTPAAPYVDAAYLQESAELIESEPLNQGVRALARLSTGRLLAATPGGLVAFDERLANPARVESWPSTEYLDLRVGPEARVIALTTDALLIGTIEEAPQSLPLPLDNPRRFRDSGGVFWLIGASEAVSLDPDGNADVRYGPYEGLAINDLCRFDADRLFVATANGVKTIDTSSGELGELIALEALPSPETTGVVCPDAEPRQAWFGTRAGLARYRDGAVEVAPGAPYLDMAGVEALSDGRLALPSDKGLMTYAPATAAWDYYHSRYWIPGETVRDALVSGEMLVIAADAGLGLIAAEAMTLEQKAAILDEAMYARHNRFGYFSGCSLGAPGDLTQVQNHDDDNDGEWTALYVAAQSLRYAVTGSAEARARAAEAADAMLRLHAVTGIPGLMARSVVEPEQCPAKQAAGSGEWHLSADGQWCWKGDTSSDEYVGHIFGLSIYYDLAADETDRARVRDAFVALHDGLMANGWTMNDVDGQPTMHGHFEPDFMHVVGPFGDAGLNSAMILGGLLATYAMSGEPRFMDAFEYLAFEEGYAEYVRKIEQINIKVRINHDSEEMSFLAMTSLIRYETDPCRMAIWQEGLAYLWEVQRPERDPEFNMLYAWMARDEANDLENSVRTLKEWYLHGVEWGVTNSHRADYTLDPKPDRFGEAQSLEVFPYDQKQVMRWAENPYRLDRDGNGRYEQMLTPWLLPYWMGRYLGLITPTI
ncbi:MAG: hypothetical protein C4523_01200 [Myxococcales bacterium]|nr:MAG: hypothetical protein C4523_01200 [Myxococcales bacterium]